MRRSESAFAIIRRHEQGRTLWLAQWNARWGAYHVVGGHREPGESFRECLVREVGEELHLREGLDYQFASVPPVPLEFTAFSEGARAQTRYIMELFLVELSPEACSNVGDDAGNRWLSETEIEAGQTHDGRRVSPTMKRLCNAVRERTA